MRVVVTGGSGFIGTAVVERLLAEGHEVAVADVVAPRRPSAASFLAGDLTEAAAVEAAVAEGTDAVVHLAAATSVLKSVKDPAGVYRSNVAMTQALLERARQVGVSRFVFASTNAVVGAGAGGGAISETSPLEPLTPYGATKAAAEMLMSAYRSSYGLGTVALRLTNVYGPGIEVKDGLVARLMKAARSGAGIEAYGDGRQVRDYVYLGDVAATVGVALGRDLPARVIVGSGVSVDVLELHRMVCEVTGVDIPLRHTGAQAGEMRAVVVDRSLADAAGLPPPTTLSSGLASTWEAFAAGAVP